MACGSKEDCFFKLLKCYPCARIEVLPMCPSAQELVNWNSDGRMSKVQAQAEACVTCALVSF